MTYWVILDSCPFRYIPQLAVPARSYAKSAYDWCACVCVCVRAFAGLDNKLYKIYGTYVKIILFNSPLSHNPKL